MNPRFISEYRMSNNEYRHVQQWIQDPTMNSLMNIQFFEGQFFEGQFLDSKSENVRTVIMNTH